MATKYPDEFKLKVLKYFLGQGGSDRYGLKAQIAKHFNIDHKTVAKFLQNDELLKKAQDLFKIKETGGVNPINIQSNNEKYVSTEKLPVEVSVVDLPEDPDYSILKPPIDSSITGVKGIAHLLIKGTSEVKQALLEECNVIMECKFCKNLFRSVVNFLAHKRIYCQDEFSPFNQSYDKDSASVLIPSEESCPEVQPESPSPPPQTKKRNIEDVVSSLASNQKDCFIIRAPSSSPLNRLHPSKRRRQVPSVILKKIDGSSKAVLQSRFTQLNKEKIGPLNTILDEIANKKRESVVSIPIKQEIEDPEPVEEEVLTKLPELILEESHFKGYKCNQCSKVFQNRSTIAEHKQNNHPIVRKIYTCPICLLTFLTLWGCSKHLHRFHKKKKHQRERLRQVISSRAVKKTLSKNELHSLKQRTLVIPISVETNNSKQSKSKSGSKEIKIIAKVTKTAAKETKNNTKEVKSSIKEQKINLKESTPRSKEEIKKKVLKKSTSTPIINGVDLEIPRPVFKVRKIVHCDDCGKRIFDSNKSHVCEQPNKKIEIQIRKEYKKEVPVIASNNNSPSVVPKLVISSETQTKLDTFCNFDNINCIPCDRKYQSLNILKRHAAIHLGWTRFRCLLCSFKSYDKYLCSQHCTNSHNEDSSGRDLVLVEEHVSTPEVDAFLGDKLQPWLNSGAIGSAFDVETESQDDDSPKSPSTNKPNDTIDGVPL